MPLAYLLDENLRGPLAKGLWNHNQRGVDPLDFLCVGDSPDLPLGAPDADILLWAERVQRVLVSGDRATLATNLAAHVSTGHHSPGIFLVPRSLLVKPIVDALVVYAYASKPDEWRDRIEYVA
jgi:hypothetical protein